jgi:beta-glucanase (GH16 family)
MENKTIRWCGYEWLTQERWGQVHPEKPNWWYDESAITILENGNMVLRTQYNPKEFDGVTSNIGVGLVSCTEKFGYGRYSIEAKLPKGPHLWPAFWMYSWESWPPEIDIFEAYSNKWGNYINFDIEALIGNVWDVQTNIHLGETPNNYNIGAKTGRMGLMNPTDVFMLYELEWTEKSVKFFYNGRLVRTLRDQNTLSQLKGKTMNVIVNNGIQSKYDINSKNVSEFVVRNFKYEKI